MEKKQMKKEAEKSEYGMKYGIAEIKKNKSHSPNSSLGLPSHGVTTSQSSEQITQLI